MHLGGTNCPLPNSPTDSRKLSPLSQFHINPAWLVFPAPEQVHLSPCITSWQGHLVPFPMFSLGKSNLASSIRQPASPFPWAQLGHPAQLHARRRNSSRLLCAFCTCQKSLENCCEMSLVAGTQGGRQPAFCCGTARACNAGDGVASENCERIASAVPGEWSVVRTQPSKLKSLMGAFCCLLAV